MDQDKIKASISKSIDDYNSPLEPDEQLSKNSDTVLFGEDGILDSLGLVSLIVCVEQRVGEDFDLPISLTDERALSQEKNPFKSIQTLTEFIANLLQEGAQ